MYAFLTPDATDKYLAEFIYTPMARGDKIENLLFFFPEFNIILMYLFCGCNIQQGNPQLQDNVYVNNCGK